MIIEHIPVLLSEVIAALALSPNDSAIDGTLGGGGHAEAILSHTGPEGRLLGIDLDQDAITRTQNRLAPYGRRAILALGNFRHLTTLASEFGFGPVQAVLLDLGVSSVQIGTPDRGFSFLYDGPLDMRMDPAAPLSASQIVNTWTVEDLARVIYEFGEEPRSRRIARAIAAARPVTSTSRLAAVVAGSVGGRQVGHSGTGGHASRGSGRGAGRSRIHPATRTFQALRIAVNDELASLAEALPVATTLLSPGGKLAVITFHSLEDRIVKQFIQRESRDCICPSGFPACRCGHKATLKAVTRKPIVPTSDEVAANPRSRSAKLRVAERLPW